MHILDWVPSLARVTESTQTTGGVREVARGRLDELRLLYLLDHKLGNPVTALHLVRIGRIGIDQEDA